MSHRVFPSLVSAVVVAVACFVVGCQPDIGDKCSVSTDCSATNDRLCDTSQPGGYCTVYNCTRGGCPSGGHCVLFNGAFPGCPYDDRALSRFARSFCMKTCKQGSDCRSGYDCVDPRVAPWNALVLDDRQEQRICLATPKYTPAAPTSVVPPVCLGASPEGVQPEGGADAVSPVGATDT